MDDKILLKITKKGGTDLLFLSINETPVGWKLSEDLKKAILNDLELYLHKFESDGYEEGIELIEKIIDELNS